MLDAVAFLGALAVVEAVERAHQIAGDAADAVEGHAAQMIDSLTVMRQTEKLQKFVITS